MSRSNLDILTKHFVYDSMEIRRFSKMRTIFEALCLFFFSFALIVNGQPKKLAIEDRQTINLPENTPAITGGALITESDPNGGDKRVWFLVTKPGTYIFRGLGSHHLIDLGGIKMDDGANGAKYVIPVYDQRKANEGMPFADPPWGIEVVRLHNSTVERMWANLIHQEPVKVLGEVVNKETYSLFTSKVPDGAVLILGRDTLFQRIEKAQMDGVHIIHFSPSMSMGPTTLTMCDKKGQCESGVFQKTLR